LIVQHTSANNITKSIVLEDDDGDIKRKRPLSAYNIFFRAERQRILTEFLLNSKTPISPEEFVKVMSSSKGKPHRKRHGKISFVDLVRTVSSRWRSLGSLEKEIYYKEARADKVRHTKEIAQQQEVKNPSKERRNWMCARCLPQVLRMIYWILKAVIFATLFVYRSFSIRCSWRHGIQKEGTNGCFF